MKSTRLLLSMAALSAGLIVSGGTRAEDWKPVGQFGFFGVGKAYEIEKGHFYWVGEFSGTFFNDKGENSLFDHAGVKCPAWDDQRPQQQKEPKLAVFAPSPILTVTRLMSHSKARGFRSGERRPRDVRVDGWNGQIQRNQRR